MLLLVAGRAAADAAPWLFLTDIHLKTGYKHAPPSRLGDDTDLQLFQSAIREMQRVDPHPPVVVVTGDLLGHVIAKKDATPTTIEIAHMLGRAFPDAQFVLALGNNDGACGDYALTPEAPFLRQAGAAWEPLVNRHGAAPTFMRTFVHDGFYTARLPIPGLQAIVVNDVPWSPRYRSGCGPAPNAAAHQLNELDTALAQAKGRVWVLFHIPPGVDAFSTAQLTHRLAIVPFLRPDMRDGLLHLLVRKPGQVALAVAGHTHKFAFRVVGATGPEPVPMLLVPSISPIFSNDSSFLTANVGSDGTLRDVDETSYLDGRWQHIGGLRDLGVDTFGGKQLVALQGRLDRDPKLRETFGRLYSGAGKAEITERTWPVYACAATAFTTADFRTCDNAGGVSFFTQRAVRLASGVAGIALIAVGAVVLLLRRRRRARA